MKHYFVINLGAYSKLKDVLLWAWVWKLWSRDLRNGGAICVEMHNQKKSHFPFTGRIWVAKWRSPPVVAVTGFCCWLETTFVSPTWTLSCMCGSGCGVCVYVGWQGWGEALLRSDYAIKMRKKKRSYNNLKHNYIILIQNRWEEPFWNRCINKIKLKEKQQMKL